MRQVRTWSWNHGRVPMSVMTMPVAIENTAKAMPASRMLPPTFSVKAEYIGTSIDSAKVVRKLIFRSSRASRETNVSIIEAKPRGARELYAVAGPARRATFSDFSARAVAPRRAETAVLVSRRREEATNDASQQRPGPARPRGRPAAPPRAAAGVRGADAERAASTSGTTSTQRGDAAAPTSAAGTLYVAAAPGHPIAGAFVVDQRQEPEYAGVAWRLDGRARGRRAPAHGPPALPAPRPRAATSWPSPSSRRAALGCGAIRLDAFTGNAPSLRLYQALGYEDVGQVRFRKGLFRCFEKGLARAREAAHDPRRAPPPHARRAPRHRGVGRRRRARRRPRSSASS